MKANTGRKADAPLEQRRVEDRVRYVEVQGALRRRHFQVHAEERAILRYNQHHALKVLKQMAAEGVVLPGLKG